MIKTASLLAAGALISSLPLSAQNADSLNKPLTEAGLLNALDSYSTSDPVRKAPLSIGDTSTSGKPESKKADEKKTPNGKGPTEITAQEASFDQKTHQAVFGGQVVVKNPEFTITCDKLTAFLRNENNKAATPAKETSPTGSAKPATTVAAAPAPAKPAAKGPDSGGLEKAIAEGSVVITQDRTDADGNVSHNVGHSRRAVYESATGDVILTGRPEVQQGINTCIATDDSTVIILNREGRMKVIGPHKTVIKDAPDNPTAPNGR
ncbi:LptA/OstA family protein [Verrucomicrobiota bacterium sgz303538]